MQISQEEKDMLTKLRGVMDFYVSTYLDYFSSKMKEEVVKYNVDIEDGLMSRMVDDKIEELKEEAAQKFNDICLLILGTIVSGKIKEVKDFEVLFLDLLRRTILRKEMSAPVVMVVDPRAKPKES